MIKFIRSSFNLTCLQINKIKEHQGFSLHLAYDFGKIRITFRTCEFILFSYFSLSLQYLIFHFLYLVSQSFSLPYVCFPILHLSGFPMIIVLHQCLVLSYFLSFVCYFSPWISTWYTSKMRFLDTCYLLIT